MINSIGGALPAALKTEHEEGRPAAAREQGAGAAVHAGQNEASEPRSKAAALASEAVDAEVWAQLDDAEREYFSRAELLGRVTYGRGHETNAFAPASRGTQLDLRG